MTSRTQRLAWRACIAATVLLLAVTYSPLVLRPGEADPWLFGLPRTLWASLLTAFAIVALTAIGAFVLPADESTDERAGEGPERP